MLSSLRLCRFFLSAIHFNEIIQFNYIVYFYNKKSHRFDFFNIHMERAHYEEEDKPPREKKRRSDLESMNARKGGDSSMGTKYNIGSVPKSKNDHLAVFFECETCHKVIKLNNVRFNK